MTAAVRRTPGCRCLLKPSAFKIAWMWSAQLESSFSALSVIWTWLFYLSCLNYLESINDFFSFWFLTFYYISLDLPVGYVHRVGHPKKVPGKGVLSLTDLFTCSWFPKGKEQIQHNTVGQGGECESSNVRWDLFAPFPFPLSLLIFPSVFIPACSKLPLSFYPSVIVCVSKEGV